MYASVTATLRDRRHVFLRELPRRCVSLERQTSAKFSRAVNVLRSCLQQVYVCELFALDKNPSRSCG
ncbi:UNVERIFIED_CONTAM: hypothetical protein FKN15_074701 [Acipenser sinensis]